MIFDDEWWDELWKDWESLIAGALGIPKEKRIHKPPNKTPVPDTFIKAFEEKHDRR